jgi:nucleoside-diphosphate-sugar epimerase
VLGAAREDGMRTFLARSAIAYGRSHGGTVGELVDSVREHDVARCVVPPEAENNSLTLVHLDDLGELYGRLLEGELSGRTLFLAVSDGPHRTREIAAVASRAEARMGGSRPGRWTRRWRS